MFNTETGNDSWLWIIIVFALLFGWGGNNGFGGGNAQGNLSAEMQRGFDNQNAMGRFDALSQALNSSAYENAQLINQANINTLQGFNGVNQTLNSGFDGINANINNLSHQLSDCCCNLRTQMLQDKYDQAQNQLNLAEIASANAVQTQNILSNLGRYVTNPPVTPYYYGTTIA